MPANVAGLIDAPLEVFGGLVSDLGPNDIPEGASPDCQDVAFQIGLVKTRPGLQNVFTAIGGNPTINYVKSYLPQSLALRMLALDSLGNFYKENPIGTLATVASGLIAAYAKSTTIFGREYIGFGDGKFGLDIPRQFDDTNFDRLSQVGPGAGPTTVVDSVAEAAINITATGANRVSGVSTITTSSVHGYLAGQTVTIAGVTDATFNGTFLIVSVPSGLTFTYTQAAADSASGNGTATLVPQISAGIHKCVVIFKTRQGYLTPPSPPFTFTTAGGRRIKFLGIPTGPANVIARIIAFTVANGASYFYTPLTIINDNTTVSTGGSVPNLDVLSDGLLAASTNVDYLFRLIELGECTGFIDYASRLFGYGERNHMNNWINLTFDGGFLGGATPLGWTADPIFGTGELRDNVNVVWGDAYRITGNGATAIVGMITQPAVKDINGVTLIDKMLGYSVRARVMRSSGLTQGTLHVHLFGTGVNTAGLQVSAAQAGTSFGEFTATLTTALGIVPSDLVLRIFADGTPGPIGGFFVIDNIEIFPTNQPNNTSLVRGSRVEDPESYDGVNGFMLFGENDGTRITSAFKFRNSLYFVKERSLWQTADDNVNEPSKWIINNISTTIGTPSVNGVGIGSDWVVIASRLGLYYYAGGEPEKISQEIQRSVVLPDGTTNPGWDAINWQFGHTLWCQVDEKNRRILVGAPTGTATSPNTVFVLDYRGLDTGHDITAHKSIHISQYTGKIFDIADARKWTRWNMTINAAAQIERPDGTFHLFMGNGAGTGKIYDLLDVENFAVPANFGDDGIAIPSYYSTYLFLRPQQEEMLQLGSHRKLFHYLTAYIEGQGNISITALPPGNYTGVVLPQSGVSLPNLGSPLFPISIASVKRTMNLVTVVTAAAHGLTGNSAAVINGVSNSVFNGIFGNLTIVNSTTFTFLQTGTDIGIILNSGNVAPLIRDLEMPVNVLAERCSFKVATNALGAWFSWRNITVSLRTDPWAPVRGTN